MSRQILLFSLALLWTCPPAEAQAPQPREPIAWTTNWFYEDAKRNFLEAADLMPAEHYGFKPAENVRTFGQIVGHIANWQFTNCSAAKGEANPNTTDFEKAEGKAATVEGIKAAYRYCDGVFQTLDRERLSAATPTGPVMFRAMSALAHPYLHYGNLITYLRIKGIVPPSTTRRGGR
jgi:uncharacterized damage-inducible protein DinB